jgi:KDO2-lipid IV(A) lauroyltransferase
MNNILYFILYHFFHAVSRLPFRALYGMSDAEYVIVYHLLRYRRKIVRKNISTSFPEKSVAEIKLIEREFYHWFCDYFFETIKLLSISREELTRRFTINNSEELEECFRNGQSVGAILGHYCNWEWLSCVGIALPENRAKGLIYHPLNNDAFDRLFIAIRTSNGGTVIPKKDILRFLIGFRRDGIMSICGYIADQAPKWGNIHLWLPFLNHDTPVFTGAERIMRKMNNAVYYVQMTRPRRGYYTCTYRLITKQPQQMADNEITKRFFAMLEDDIRSCPQYYLWSHNRWKRTHEEFDRRFIVENGKVIKRENVK